MFKKGLQVFILVFILEYPNKLQAQDSTKIDTFFLAKKNGLIGKIGRSLTTSNVFDIEPIKIENPFIPFSGKIIHEINVIQLGFKFDIYDSTNITDNFGVRIATFFHAQTKEKIIRKFLFFKMGQLIAPYLLADNERYLRQLSFLKDARIMVVPFVGDSTMVKVIVITKDVFSIGGNLDVSSPKRGTAELREENFGGTGTIVKGNILYDKNRFSNTAYGGEIVFRNVKGSFTNLTFGINDFKNSYTNARNEEKVAYGILEKPYISPYIAKTGSLEMSYHKTKNQYNSDSTYRNNFMYEYYNMDGYMGLRLDDKSKLNNNIEIKMHTYIGLRAFSQHFLNEPKLFANNYDFRFANTTGALAGFALFKQSFYKTNFIYGFGRKEDVPEGFTAALTIGYVSKSNLNRPYIGLELQSTSYKKRNFFSNYTFRIGGFRRKARIEDLDLLINADYFTRLIKLKPSLLYRAFLGIGYATQINPVLNTPLFLNSDYGLPYYNGSSFASDMRTTIKTENVLYSTRKLLGFRFAGFVFGDVSFLKPYKKEFKSTEFFPAIGGGIRTRNENLVFGTMELKGYYFPKNTIGLKSWKVELSTNIRFTYKNSFITKPSIVSAN